MIISTGRRYIFVHIPKTGGTSLSLALEDRAMKDDILIGDTPKAKNRRRRLDGVQASGRVWKHSTLRDIYGLVTQQQIDDFFIFTLVRNPWDRAVSYYHWLRAQGFEHTAVQLAKSLDFAEFIQHDHTQASLRAAPYGSYVQDCDGVDRCRAFVRLEHLDSDLAPVEAHLGFRLQLEHVNASKRGAGYQSYYDDSTAGVIADVCRVDIERFQYTF